MNPLLTVLQHGYSHENHAPVGERKCELGLDRPLSEIRAELELGQGILTQMFTERFCPVLVPPWNRLCVELVELLPRAGFIGLSTLGPRGGSALGLEQVNVHVDLINWRAGRRFVGEQQALAQLVTHLRMRREAKADPREATGIMTHHLVHDEQVWAFLARLFEISREQGALWCPAASLFSAGTD
ncbi:hypothetical protein GCM10011352_21490 [Marinobacterium zhoushanense]|uniref:Broad specificity phosphatase PhoE n=2 Tax=Marinobacterium zhoushanense TaxID=1679163 RepID=A0ABQ1KCY7_9GAMM|nr:hypothetical protein GCM10011352_21490 [Marinobacterium zhoushanense]